MCRKREPGTTQQRLQNIPQCKDSFVEDVRQLSVFDSTGGKRCELSGLDTTVPAALCKAQENALQALLNSTGAFPIKGGMLRKLKDPTLYSGTIANSAAEQLQEAASLVSQVLSCSYNKCVESSKNPSEVQGFPLYLQWPPVCLHEHFPSFSGPCSYWATCCCLLSHLHLQVVQKLEKGAFQKQQRSVELVIEHRGTGNEPLGGLVGFILLFVKTVVIFVASCVHMH